MSFDLLVEQDGLDKKNIEVLTTFKQGQDAVEQGLVATDYGDAILIPLSIIESTNKEIRALGDDKVKVLTNTRNFRKRINYMTWEHEYLEDKAMNMEQHYTDFQFLRVSAQVKQVLSGAKTESDRAKMEVRGRARCPFSRNDEGFPARHSNALRQYKTSPRVAARRAAPQQAPLHAQGQEGEA